MLSEDQSIGTLLDNLLNYFIDLRLYTSKFIIYSYIGVYFSLLANKQKFCSIKTVKMGGNDSTCFGKGFLFLFKLQQLDIQTSKCYGGKMS